MMKSLENLKFRELAPGCYVRAIPEDVKVTMEDVKRWIALTDSQALADMILEVYRRQEELSKPKKRKKRFLGLIPR